MSWLGVCLACKPRPLLHTLHALLILLILLEAECTRLHPRPRRHTPRCTARRPAGSAMLPQPTGCPRCACSPRPAADIYCLCTYEYMHRVHTIATTHSQARCVVAWPAPPRRPLPIYCILSVASLLLSSLPSPLGPSFALQLIRHVFSSNRRLCAPACAVLPCARAQGAARVHCIAPT